METKKLRRSVEEKVIGGVSGGLGEYFGTDPVIFRILFVVLTLTGGGGVFIYLLMWIFIPKSELDFSSKHYHAPNSNTQEKTEKSEKTAENATEDEVEDAEMVSEEPTEAKEKDPSLAQRKKNGNLIGGTILIMVGLFFIADDFLPWLDWEYLWPAALIIAGLAIIKINYKSKNQ